MKKVLLIIAIATTSVTTYAQESAPQVPPPKNVVDVKYCNYLIPLQIKI
jgi:hypothetical protein